jgi:hypothetical protein
MGKRDRERKQRIQQGIEQPISPKQEKKEAERQVINASILQQLKSQWKVAVEKQYETEPDKVRNSNIDKNTDDTCGNFQVKMIMKMQHITRDDIKRILTEIKDEVCTGG